MGSIFCSLCSGREKIFLKTAFPHRGATREFLWKGNKMDKYEKELSEAYDRGLLDPQTPVIY
jgi:hypothetical protein